MRSRRLQDAEPAAIWIAGDVPSPSSLDDGLLSEYEGTDAGQSPDLGLKVARAQIEVNPILPVLTIGHLLQENLGALALCRQQALIAASQNPIPGIATHSRIAGWDITITDTIADNASSGLFVLAGRRLTLEEFEPRDANMRLYRGDELVSEGNGAACLGDPLTALGWLARTAREFGDPLRAGQIILSGALGPMVPAPSGSRFRAEINPLGEITATFCEEENS